MADHNRGPGFADESSTGIPSPTYQCTNAHFEYKRSDLWSSQLHAVDMAVVLDNMHMLCATLAKLPLGTCDGGSLQTLILKPMERGGGGGEGRMGMRRVEGDRGMVVGTLVPS